METAIPCPICRRKISGKPIIADAAKGVGSDTQFLICECGERISYWQITALLRNQKTSGRKIQSFFQGIFKGHAWNHATMRILLVYPECFRSGRATLFDGQGHKPVL